MELSPSLWFRLPCYAVSHTCLIRGQPYRAPVRAGSGAVRIDPFRFLAGCRKRRLNQALSVLSLSLEFLSVSVVLLTRARFRVILFCVICVFCLWVVLVRLSVPVLVTDWKDSSPK